MAEFSACQFLSETHFIPPSVVVLLASKPQSLSAQVRIRESRRLQSLLKPTRLLQTCQYDYNALRAPLAATEKLFVMFVSPFLD